MTNIEIKNLTPHEITIVDNGNQVIKVLPSEGIARVKTEIANNGNLGDIPMKKIRFFDLEGLPPYEIGIFYVVSIITAQAAKAEGRDTSDLLLTADTVRDENGRIIGCRGLSFYE